MKDLALYHGPEGRVVKDRAPYDRPQGGVVTIERGTAARRAAP
ncbi:hypothetical protein ACFQ6N_21090 [Kitasatospora sp. NPDC056446]